MDAALNGGSDAAPRVYPASRIKRRHRSTRAEVEQRRAALYEIVAAMRPMTVRQVFYQASVRGGVEKSEAGYDKVQTDLALMRRAGDMPFGWLADNTKWQRKAAEESERSLLFDLVARIAAEGDREPGGGDRHA